MRKIVILAAALATAPLGVALAQESGAAAGAHAGHAMASDAAATMPAACDAAAPDMEMPAAMDGMGGGENQSPVQMGNMAAMEAMHGPMMRAASIEDADLAFNCGMIAHHHGAIAMAEVELEHGTDEESRALAEKIIADQQREIEQMTAWIEAHAEAQ